MVKKHERDWLLTASHSLASSPGGSRTASLKLPLPKVASICCRSCAPYIYTYHTNLKCSFIHSSNDNSCRLSKKISTTSTLLPEGALFLGRNVFWFLWIIKKKRISKQRLCDLIKKNVHCKIWPNNKLIINFIQKFKIKLLYAKQ